MYKRVFSELKNKVNYSYTYPYMKLQLTNYLLYLNQTLFIHKNELFAIISDWKPRIVCLTETCITNDIFNLELNWRTTV